MDAEGFLRLVRKHTDIKELTPEIFHEFIDKFGCLIFEFQISTSVQFLLFLLKEKCLTDVIHRSGTLFLAKVEG